MNNEGAADPSGPAKLGDGGAGCGRGAWTLYLPIGEENTETLK